MVEYRTIDTNELAPYPDMTSDDLQDFETYCDELDAQCNEWGWTIIIVVVGIVVLIALG